MTFGNDLFLHEEIMLLALRDDTGTVAAGTMYQYALGGAILAELLLAKRIEAEPTKRKLINLIDETPMGDPIIDECIRKIATARRRGALQTWVSKFASARNLHHRVAEGLVRRGILQAAEGKILFIFTRKIYPEADHTPEARLIERLRQAIFTDTIDLDPRTVVLASLARSANLLTAIFDKKQIKQRKARLDQIINGELTGKAAKDAIAAMQAAMMVAVMIPVMMSTMSSSH